MNIDILIEKPARSIAMIVLVSLVTLGGSAAFAGTWKAIFLSGDDSIPAFDRGREAMAATLSAKGDFTAFHLTSNQALVDLSVRPPATARNLEIALKKLKIETDDKCLIHMTSHGKQKSGLYLSKSRNGPLMPDQFAKLVNEYCGERQTVILISACYSGQFITEELKGPNRIILTASRDDRASFGCSPEAVYTYWDGCVLGAIPTAQSWYQVHTRTKQCVDYKEKMKYLTPASEPQGFFGEKTRGTQILD